MITAVLITLAVLACLAVGKRACHVHHPHHIAHQGDVGNLEVCSCRRARMCGDRRWNRRVVS